MNNIKVRISVQFIDPNSMSSTDDEIMSYVEENVCIHCRKVAKTYKKSHEYYPPTKCKEGSVCGAASILQVMIKYELIKNNSNTIAGLIKKIVDLENICE